MPTNKPTIKALRGFSELIDGLDTKPKQEVIDEIKAWNKLLKDHLTEQGRQGGKWEGHSYAYNPKTKKVDRLDASGNKVRI